MALKRSQPRPPASPDETGEAVSDDQGDDSSSGGSSGSDTARAKKPSVFVRKWPPADEISLLEAVASHRQRHGRTPSPDDLVAALHGHLLTDGLVDAQTVSRRLASLRHRYYVAWKRISSRGVVPVKDHDLKIYRLSKLLWEAKLGTRQRKKKPSIAHHEPRELGLLEVMYPCLSAMVDAIEASRPCTVAGMLRRSFGRIGDEKAVQLETKAKKLLLAEVKVAMQLGELRNKVTRTLLELIE
ncbi:hypothetical protein ABZP36_020643 [Zizania latifolia]